MIPLKEWLASEEVQDLKRKGQGKLASKEFFRDPLRSIHMDPDAFYSPADGVILYVYPSIGPKEAIVEVKGKKFTVQKLIDKEDYQEKSIVIGIFMTQFSVHVNRMPTHGYLTQETQTPYLFTPNISMVLEENAILKEAQIQPEDMGYLFMNERKVVRIYYPRIRSHYFLIQIAEKDVDVILNFGIGKHQQQGDRYGIVRFGSQVDMVIPLCGKTKYQIHAKEKYYVKAGIDKLVTITS